MQLAHRRGQEPLLPLDAAQVGRLRVALTWSARTKFERLLRRSA